MQKFATRIAVLAALCLCAPGIAQKTPEEALQALKAGNERFVNDRSVAQPLGEGVRHTLARGQSPYAIVLSCADSRVPPEHVFNAGLGELFVVRMAGNTCDAETLASIEYAAEHLGAGLCVVLGHEGCGAIRACAEQVQAANAGKTTAVASSAIQQLLEQLEPSVRRALTFDLGGKELTDKAEAENAQRTALEVQRRSPLLRRLVKAGRFQVVPARYHLESGEVEWLAPRPLPAENLPAELVKAEIVPANLPPHVALRLLQAGHRRFLSAARPTADIGKQRRASLAGGQQPLAVVVTCADSRVAPEHVFDAGLGELFVVRVAGNVVNDDVLASIEYAVAHTGASLVVFMGHSKCGAVTAATVDDKGTHSPAMHELLAHLAPAVERARAQLRPGDDLVELSVRTNVLRATEEVRAKSRIVQELEQGGRLALLPAVYDLATGDLEWLKDGPATAPASVPSAPGGETAPAREHRGTGKAGNGEAPRARDGHANAGHAGEGHEGTAAHGDEAEAKGDGEHGKAAHEGAEPAHGESAHAAPEGNGHGAEHQATHGENAATPPGDGKHGDDAEAGNAGKTGNGNGNGAHGGESGEHAENGEHAEHGEGAHGKGGTAAGEGEDATPPAPARSRRPAKSGSHGGHGDAEHEADADDGDARIDPKSRSSLADTDKVMLVGAIGVVSLLLAAILAMQRKAA